MKSEKRMTIVFLMMNGLLVRKMLGSVLLQSLTIKLAYTIKQQFMIDLP